MNLIVFGATGSVGTHVVKQALQQGHSVTAFTRSADKLSSLSHPALSIITGDLINSANVENAVKGHNAVICAIGDGRKGKIRAAGTKNIINAMQKAGLKRLICQSTLGAGESRANLNFLWKHIIFGLLLKKAYKDHEEQEKYVLDSSLDWTIVRPGAFTNGEVTNNYKVGFDGSVKNLRLKISRADIANFMLRQVKSDEYLRKAVSISN